MIEVKDRVVQYPNRYQLTAVAGQSNTYDLTPVPGAVTSEGTPVNKALLDHYLAASGTTGGSATALTLTQAGFSLADGVYIRAKLHTAIKNSVTLNVNGTGAKSLVCVDGRAPYLPSGTYFSAVYNSSTGKYICLSECQGYVFGSYTGDDTYPRTVQVGFTPSMVLVIQGSYLGIGSTLSSFNAFLIHKDYPVQQGTTTKKDVLTIVTNGFKLLLRGNNIDINNGSFAYRYMAFR